MNLDEIKRHKAQLTGIASKYGIVRILLFGSVARGESTPSSDLDFLIEMKEGASLLGVGGFSHEVEQIFGVHVDVIPISILSGIADQGFARRIQSEAVPL